MYQHRTTKTKTCVTLGEALKVWTLSHIVDPVWQDEAISNRGPCKTTRRKLKSFSACWFNTQAVLQPDSAACCPRAKELSENQSQIRIAWQRDLRCSCHERANGSSPWAQGAARVKGLAFSGKLKPKQPNDRPVQGTNSKTCTQSKPLPVASGTNRPGPRAAVALAGRAQPKRT